MGIYGLTTLLWLTDVGNCTDDTSLKRVLSTHLTTFGGDYSRTTYHKASHTSTKQGLITLSYVYYHPVT